MPCLDTEDLFGLPRRGSTLVTSSRWWVLMNILTGLPTFWMLHKMALSRLNIASRVSLASAVQSLSALLHTRTSLTLYFRRQVWTRKTFSIETTSFPQLKEGRKGILTLS